ncbi:MAG TPA: nitronate monooxygenase [Stellaceae bacterium]|nr:nitronate monooxygenase [Stellaceae bacterium]
MPLATRLTECLDIRHPVLLAPMGSIAGGRLAAAVTAAGGLGLIGGGYGDGEWLEREFSAAGNHRVGCGFITWSLARRPELLAQALAHGPAAVMLSFGDPKPFAPPIRAAGAKLICQVQTLAHVDDALAAGAEIIVAQGSEAGGHGATRATLPLVPQVVDRVRRRAPEAMVVAAGGIGDGRGLAAALMLGAEGVLVGTRFYASEESLARPQAKARMIEATGEETIRTSVFDTARGIAWPKEFTGRALNNDFARRWHGSEAELAAAVEREMARYQAAAAMGDFSTAVIFGGEAMGLFDRVLPAGDIVGGMVAEAEAALRAGAQHIAG